MKTALLAFSLLGGAVWAATAADARLVPGEQVCAAARALLVEAAGKQGLVATVECPNARDLEVGAGPLAWALDAQSAALATGPSRAVLQLTVNGAQRRSVGVPVVLALRSKAWVARRAIGVGEPIAESDLELRDVSWPVGASPEAASNAVPVGRARVALKSGDVLTATKLTPPSQKLQGDTVRVALHSGAVTLEMPAVLAANAQIGHLARVQLKGRYETLEGVLVDASTVIVER